MEPQHRLTILVDDERGATAIEYGLIIALVVLAMFVALKGVADENTEIWAIVSSEVMANM